MLKQRTRYVHELQMRANRVTTIIRKFANFISNSPSYAVDLKRKRV